MVILICRRSSWTGTEGCSQTEIIQVCCLAGKKHVLQALLAILKLSLHC